MYGTSEWWYKRGVAGFRLDAVSTLFEDPNLKNNPILPGKNKPMAIPTWRTSTTTSCPKFTTC